MNNDQILLEAKERFQRCSDWESSCRAQYVADVKFGNGDSTNNYQYPQSVLNDRLPQNKPCLTVNRTRQYCLQIINDSRQNKPEIEVRAVGEGASFKSAEIFEGIIRHIQYVSNAQQAYDAATWSQVFGGLGYFRIVTDYAHDDSFDQEIFIKRVSDPLSIYLDPNIAEYDGSDAKYGFVFRDMDRKDFESEYPRHKDLSSGNPFNQSDSTGWNSKDRVRVAEYYRVVNVPDTLHVLDNGSIVRQSQVEDHPDPGLLDQLKINSVSTRESNRPVVEHYLIAGNEIIERSIWAGKYIPIIRVVGEETIIDGQLDRKGHVRALISPQQAYNYFSSAGIEFVALQSKSPWVAPVAAMEGFEEDYAKSNVENVAVLPYNHIDDAGNPIPPPVRQEPPSYATAYLDGMKVSTNEMQLASGQFEAVMGEESNERSAKAIQERQRGGLNATYHYIDHLSSALRFAGKILIDLIPKIYDTPRILKILALDGTMGTVQIDPDSPQAHQPAPIPADPEGFDPAHVSAIFNPSIGCYDVIADNGPDYATRRLQAFNALSQIITQNEQMAPVVADLWARSADFPLSDILADRLKNLVPPEALGKVNPQVVQLQQQLAAQHQVMQTLSDELKEAKSRMLASNMQKDVNFYDAETRRLAAVGKIDEQALKPIVREMVSQLLGVPVNQAIHAHMIEQAQMEQSLLPDPTQSSPAPSPNPPPMQ